MSQATETQRGKHPSCTFMKCWRCQEVRELVEIEDEGGLFCPACGEQLIPLDSG